MHSDVTIGKLDLYTEMVVNDLHNLLASGNVNQSINRYVTNTYK